MMARTEISALMANLRAKSRATAVPLARFVRHEHDCPQELRDSESVACTCGLADAVAASVKPDPLFALSADLIQDLLERLATLEDQHG
jgi:hypothetical protein